MFTDVHGEGTSAATEAVSLGSELAAVALLAPQGLLMGVDVDGVQSLVAQVALEAHLVPLVASGEELFGGVHGLVTLGTDSAHVVEVSGSVETKWMNPKGSTLSRHEV